MPKYTKSDIQSAIADVESGCSRRAAASKWGIPRSTLLGRLTGAGSRKQRDSDRQKLSASEEQSLVEWVRIQYRLQLPPTQVQLRLIAQHMLHQSGSNETLGKHWAANFLARHDSIKALKGKQMEKARVEAVTPDKIKAFFLVLEEPLLKQIRPSNRWNMDETGIMEGILREQKVLGPSSAKTAVKKVQKRNKWTSIIECVSAEGNWLPPTVIWCGKSVQQQWFTKDRSELQKFRTWSFHTSENGYTSNEAALEWLTTCFIPMTASGRNDWRLLVLDGHESHISDAFTLACYTNKIWLLSLPSHSSHITQPLDVGVFASLKINYRQAADNITMFTNGDDLLKSDFLESYYKGRQQGITMRNIRSGWRKSGLWPVNVDQALAHPRLFQKTQIEPRPVTPTTEEVRDSLKTPAAGAEVRKTVYQLRKELP